MKQKVRILAFLRTLKRSVVYTLMCILILVYYFFPHACCCWFACTVFDVFVSVYLVYIVSCCVRFRCVLVIYLFHIHGLCFGAVAYCFHVK